MSAPHPPKAEIAPPLFAMSPMRRNVDIEGEVSPLYQHELRELLRGFCGALVVALPLLYTQEMWERAREIHEGALVVILLAAFVINVGYTAYSGFKRDPHRAHLFWDPLTAMGLGLAASYVTLLITSRIVWSTPPAVQISLLALMVVPTSFGAALAINQLGKRGGGGEKDESLAPIHLSEDMQKVTATVLGGVLFAFNIVPTIEPKVMLSEVAAGHVLAILVFSLMVSYGINFTARFHTSSDGSTDSDSGVFAGKLLSTAAFYLISLLVSAALLWAFGYLGLDTPPAMALCWVVIVGYCTTLGGAAGRLIL